MAMKDERYVTVDGGAEIYACLLGQSGPVLVFTPGWSFSHDIFVHQAEALRHRYRCLFYDPRGQGRSSATLDGNNYTQHGRDLRCLITAFGLSEVVLVSWSYGVLAAYALVRQFGTDGLTGFVCIDEPAKPMSSEDGAWAEGPPDVLGEYLRAVQNGQRGFLNDYAGYMVSRPLSNDERRWIVDQGTRTPPFVAASLFADGHFSDYTSEAQLLDRSVPCLTFLRQDWAPQALAWIAAHTPTTRTVVMPSHLMFWEFPERFNSELAAFLDGLPRKI